MNLLDLSDQPAHPHRLIRVFAACLQSLDTVDDLCAAEALIRLNSFSGLCECALFACPEDPLSHGTTCTKDAHQGRSRIECIYELHSVQFIHRVDNHMIHNW